MKIHPHVQAAKPICQIERRTGSTRSGPWLAATLWDHGFGENAAARGLHKLIGLTVANTSQPLSSYGPCIHALGSGLEPMTLISDLRFIPRLPALACAIGRAGFMRGPEGRGLICPSSSLTVHHAAYIWRRDGVSS